VNMVFFCCPPTFWPFCIPHWIMVNITMPHGVIHNLVEGYNQFAPAPWQIQGRIDRSANVEKATGIRQIDAALQFPAALQTSLKSALFYSYYKVDGSGQPLLTLKDQAPLLLAANAANSKLYLFTSSADLDWNDLALTSAYVPLIHGLLKEAAGLTGSSLPAGISWGEPFASDRRPTQVKGADGGPGIYQFSRSGGEFRRGVNPPYEESDLVKLSTAELKKKFGPVEVQVVAYQADRFEAQPGGRSELWPLLLGFLLAVLAVEMIVANGIWPFTRSHFKTLFETDG